MRDVVHIGKKNMTNIHKSVSVKRTGLKILVDFVVLKDKYMMLIVDV